MKWSPFAAIAVVFIAGWVLVTPWPNVPVIDDWVYAWSVEHLLRTRELRVSDFSSIYPIAQILWGALFAGVAGFSFGILRLSTVVLAYAGCAAIYLTLLELEIDPRVSLVAALTVALSPVYFALSFTFMTDVPFVALCSIALFCYVSALVRGEPRRLWWGGAAAMLAFFIRPIGVVLPLSVVAGFHPREWKTAARDYGPPLMLTVAAMVAGWLAMPIVLGRLPIADSRIQDLSYLALVSPRTYAGWNLNLPIIAAFSFAPMLFASLLSLRRAVAIAAVAATLAVISWMLLGHLATPLPNWQTWSLEDLATRGGLIGGDLQPSAWSVRAAPWVAIAGIVAAACLFVGVASARFRVPRGMRVLLAFALLHVLLFNVLWFFNDRYYLVLAPSLAYFAAAPFAGEQWNRRLLWVAAPMLAFVGVRERNRHARHACDQRHGGAPGARPRSPGHSTVRHRRRIFPERLAALRAPGKPSTGCGPPLQRAICHVQPSHALCHRECARTGRGSSSRGAAARGHLAGEQSRVRGAAQGAGGRAIAIGSVRRRLLGTAADARRSTTRG